MNFKCVRCKCTLKKGVQFIAILEMIICTVTLTIFTLILFDVCFGGKTANSIEYFLGINREVQFTIWYISWMIAFIKLMLDINLYKGASTKSRERCQIWFNVTAGVLLMNYVWSSLSLNIFWSYRNCMMVILINVVLGVYKGVEMLLVYKLMQKMDREKPDIFTIAPTAPRLSIDGSINERHFRRQSRWPVNDWRNPSSTTLNEYLTPDEFPSLARYNNPM